MNDYADGSIALNRSKNYRELNLSFETDKNTFGLSEEFIRQLDSSIPVAVLEPNLVRKRAEEFVAAFPGRVMYAVKCNPDPIFIEAMYDGGVNCFDAASLHEVALIRERLPFASIYFMHPIKAPEAIYEAYHTHKVRSFVLDYQGELNKILHVLPDADDLELFVRIAVPKGKVATDFSTKFGAKFEESIMLLREARAHCARLGVSFHVGTQCTDSEVYFNAVRYAIDVIKVSRVEVESLDIGGGFPAVLDVDNPPPVIEDYMQMVVSALADSGFENMELLCEAGRGLVADGGSLVVRVEGRKGDLLYINDGTYGGLFEAGGSIGLPYPARLIRKHPVESEAEIKAFRFAGPTCDSVDMMNGPFMLPEDVQVGDWIALDKLGAYGEVSRTNFNGFGEVVKIVMERANPFEVPRIISMQ